jgi:hypothetical protein
MRIAHWQSAGVYLPHALNVMDFASCPPRCPASKDVPSVSVSMRGVTRAGGLPSTIYRNLVEVRQRSSVLSAAAR